MRPALVEHPAFGRRPSTELGLRHIEVKERLERIGRHLVDVQCRIDQPRTDCMLGRDQRNFGQGIQLRHTLLNTLDSAVAVHGDSRIHHLPQILVKSLDVRPCLHRHGVGHVGLDGRLVGAMAQEFHLHAELIQKALVEQRSATDTAPSEMGGRLDNNAVGSRRGKENRRAHVIQVRDNLAAACLVTADEPGNFAGDAQVSLVSGKV